MYGCTETQRQQIIHRLDNLELAYNHPTLLPGLLAELDRIRLVGMVDNLLDSFTLRAWADRELDLDMDKAKLSSFLQLCFESRILKNQMQAVKKQLAKMMAETTKFGASIPKKSNDDLLAQFQKRLECAGEQINSQLDDISTELDDKINDCNMIIDNMSLTMQTVWNHFAREDNKMNLRLSGVSNQLARTNTELSQDMKGDSSQMRSIALLTMVFLPISTVASIFSTTLFHWDSTGGGAIVSSYIWVFVIIAVGLTSVTVGAWYLATRRSRRKESDRKSSRELGFSMNDLP